MALNKFIIIFTPIVLNSHIKFCVCLYKKCHNLKSKFLSGLPQKSLKARHGYCYSGEGGNNSINNIHLLWLGPFSPLPYNLGSPYLDHTLTMVNTCQPGMSHLTFFSFRWFNLFTLLQVFVVWLVFPLPYTLGSPYLVSTLIMVSTCLPVMCHVTLTWLYDLPTLLDLYHVFVISWHLMVTLFGPSLSIEGTVFGMRSISPLPYNLGLHTCFTQ